MVRISSDRNTRRATSKGTKSRGLIPKNLKFSLFSHFYWNENLKDLLGVFGSVKFHFPLERLILASVVTRLVDLANVHL